MRTKARYETISLEVVEWSEQLRPVTSIWLGAVRRSVQVRLCTSGCKSEKMFGVISPPRDLLPSIIIILPASGVRCESVSHASRTICVFRGAECVVVRICGTWLCMCGSVCVVFF